MKKLLLLLSVIISFNINAQVCVDSTLINPNCVCNMIYQPVCGCDGNSYDNSCYADKSGVISYTAGECCD